MNKVTIKLENDKVITYYFGSMNVITITSNSIEMRLDHNYNLPDELADGVCKYTYSHKIIGVDIDYV